MPSYFLTLSMGSHMCSDWHTGKNPDQFLRNATKHALVSLRLGSVAFPGRSMEAMSMRSMRSCTTSHGCCYCLNSPSRSAAISNLTFFCACLMIPVCELKKPTVRATTSLAHASLSMMPSTLSASFCCTCQSHLFSATQFQHSLCYQVVSGGVAPSSVGMGYLPVCLLGPHLLSASFRRVACLCLSTSPPQLSTF